MQSALIYLAYFWLESYTYANWTIRGKKKKILERETKYGRIKSIKTSYHGIVTVNKLFLTATKICLLKLNNNVIIIFSPTRFIRRIECAIEA